MSHPLFDNRGVMITKLTNLLRAALLRTNPARNRIQPPIQQHFIFLSILAVAVLITSVRTVSAQACPSGVYLGKLSANPFITDSTSNAYGRFGGSHSSVSVNNSFGTFGSAFSSKSVANPYATDAPKIIAADGTYLGRLSANPYDPESVSNPYGKYGNPYSAKSINNPYGKYGSSFSPTSANNPLATRPPILCGSK